MPITRPNSVEIDETAVAKNLATIRAMLPEGTGLWQVCKGDGYGLGTVRAAQLGTAAGLDRFCVGTPDEALELREAFPEARVLLFPSALAEDLAELGRRGVTVSIHNRASLQAILRHASDIPCWIKVDTGLRRFGFSEESWDAALAAIADGALPGLEGIYTHFSQSSDSLAVDRALSTYDRYLEEARNASGRRLASMVAASPTLLARPNLPYDFVDPGRAFYGMFPEADTGIPLVPVVSAVRSRLIDSRSVDADSAQSFGYSETAGAGVSRVGVMPIGHFDGLNGRAPFGSVIIRGVRAPVLSRTLLSSLIDLSQIPDARDGDEITLIGRNSSMNVSIHECARELGSTATMLHFGLIRHLPKQDSPEL